MSNLVCPGIVPGGIGSQKLSLGHLSDKNVKFIRKFMDSYDSHTEGERILVDVCGFILAQKLLVNSQQLKDVWGFLQGHPVLVKWWLNYCGTVETGRFDLRRRWLFHNVSRIFEGCSHGKSRAECRIVFCLTKTSAQWFYNHFKIWTEHVVFLNTRPKVDSPQRCANITGAFFAFQEEPSPHEKDNKTPNHQPHKKPINKKTALPNGPDGTFHSTTVPPLIGGRCCCCALLGGGLGAGRCTQHRTASAHSANH